MSYITDSINFIGFDFKPLEQTVETKVPKWIEKLVDENAVICDILRNFDTNNVEEVTEARTLFARYKLVQGVLANVKKNNEEITYDELLYKSGHASNRAKRRRIIALISDECQICGTNIISKLRENIIHHVEPVYKGGSYNYINLAILCPECHTGLHDCIRYPYEYEQIKTQFMSSFKVYLKFLEYVHRINPENITDLEFSLMKSYDNEVRRKHGD